MKKLKTVAYTEGRVSEFAMSNIGPDKTNLGAFIWFSTRGNSKHGPRIKVSNIRDKYDDKNTFSVSIGSEPKVIVGKPTGFKAKELQAIFAWVKKAQGPLLKHWRNDVYQFDSLDTLEALRELKLVKKGK